MADKIATRQAYGEALIELVEKNDKVVVLDADLANATQTCKVAKAHPEKFYNCGIAEANMVDIAAGMSTMGLIPYCSSFAMFAAGRAYEQIRNSIAYPHFNVKICATHAGVSVGEDGGSHQCIEDIALMRVIPGMTVICPADANEAKAATMAIAEMNGPVYMRLARLATPVFEGDMVQPFEIGKANVLREGKDVAIFATGLMVSESLPKRSQAMASTPPSSTSTPSSPSTRSASPNGLKSAARSSPSRSTASSAAWATPWLTS